MKRELFFKNLVSRDKTKKFVTVKEIVHHDGMIAKSTRACFYHLNILCKLDNSFNLDEMFIKQLEVKNHKPKNIYIRKNLNPEQGGKKFSWKVTGRLYIVSKNYILACDFKHTFKLELIEIDKKV